MPDIIRLLPDAVANQIAAGEVIQRPASVVKELMENAVDSGADSIKVNIKDAGRTLIQIIDNGCGMSVTDARMAFERHSTSKISRADDLFAIHTLGFRGEALASIAAIAEISLKSRRLEDEIGTEIVISGSEIQGQNPVSCPPGSNFSVKNLFYNVPARRKFLKANTTEFRNIIQEFYRVALTYPALGFSLIHNGTEVYNLAPTSTKQRIISIFGKNTNQILIPVQTETSIIKINGFVGKPEAARRTFGEQFYFVNNRYMRHSYFHKAVMEAYAQVLPPETFPSYFLYMEISPENIDINIHPTKTEIKFEDERSIYQILHATIREALGKHSMVPTLDFDQENGMSIPIFKKNRNVSSPLIDINPEFNPFESENSQASFSSGKKTFSKDSVKEWENLYRDLDEAEKTISGSIQQKLEQSGGQTLGLLFQFKKKYILLPVKSGLMVIDQKRAHERVLYEKFLQTLTSGDNIPQQELFPRTVELNTEDHSILIEIIDDICSLGFDIRDLGNNTVVINGFPADSINREPEQWIDDFLSDYRERDSGIKEKAREKIAASMARSASIRYDQTLQPEEMRELFDRLFACKEPGQNPDGKVVFMIIRTEDLDKKFN